MRAVLTLLAVCSLFAVPAYAADCMARCSDQLQECMRDCRSNKTKQCPSRCQAKQVSCMKPCQAKAEPKDPSKMCVDDDGNPMKCPRQ